MEIRIKKLVILMLLFNSVNLFSQDKFYSGGWHAEFQKSTKISLYDFPQNKIFKISCTPIVDSKNARFYLYPYQNTNHYEMNEDGCMLLEGKNVIIEQQYDGTYLNGSWEIVKLDSIDFYTFSWVANPNYGKTSILAMQTEVEFNISINLKSNNCQNGKMIIFVDGFPISDKNGNRIKFSEGSSVIGKGKVVEVQTEGTCSQLFDGFVGQIKIRKI